jgi:hypothetical protein
VIRQNKRKPALRKGYLGSVKVSVAKVVKHEVVLLSNETIAAGWRVGCLHKITAGVDATGVVNAGVDV